MTFKIRRIILFVRDLQRAARFYRGMFGLKPRGSAEGKEWAEFEGGGCLLALHRGAAAKSGGGPKIVFGARDVAVGRRELLDRGAKVGPVRSFDGIDLCDGRDPDGNRFQISNRP